MMSQFFIRRPVFAWVIAIFIILFGLLSIPKLPIARFPSVAPPQVNISATYPGATAKTINDSVVTLIERELSGVKKSTVLQCDNGYFGYSRNFCNL